MSLNQQLREPRLLVSMTPRLIAFMALAVAVLITAGCQSSEPLVEARAAPAPAPAEDAGKDPADDLTATEAAIAGMNEAPASDAAPGQTAQLLRPDAPIDRKSVV